MMETRGILVDVNIAAKKIQQKNNPIVIDFYIILAFEIQQESLSNPLKSSTEHEQKEGFWSICYYSKTVQLTS